MLTEGTQLWQQLGAGVFVLAVLGVFLWTMQRRGLTQFRPAWLGAAPERNRMRLVERLTLPSQNSLLLVEISGQPWLISASSTGLSAVELSGSKADPAEAEAGEAEPSRAATSERAAASSGLARQLEDLARASRSTPRRRSSLATNFSLARYAEAPTAAAYWES